MNEKIDDLAKAIRDECQKHGYLVSIPDSDRLWGNLARAVKPAMREPTPEMIERLGKVLYDHYGDQKDRYYASEWEEGVRAFIECWIDEALK